MHFSIPNSDMSKKIFLIIPMEINVILMLNTITYNIFISSELPSELGLRKTVQAVGN